MYAGFILCIQGDNKNSSTPTWRANATYEEVVQSFFVSDLTDLETDLITEKKFVSLTTESIFKVPFGFCKSIRKVKFDNPIFLGTCKDFSITIVDSSQSTPLGLFDSPKGSIQGSVSGGSFEDSYYDISVDIYDDHIHEGVTCTAYEKLDSTYSNCVENVVTSQLLSWYSCLPPWINS